jgi:hypothetical protein
MGIPSVVRRIAENLFQIRFKPGQSIALGLSARLASRRLTLRKKRQERGDREERKESDLREPIG